MREFDFYSPETVPEACKVLAQHKDSVAIVAGGTDLVLELNERKISPAVIVDVKKLKELEYIRIEDGIVHIGALTTHASIAADPYIKEHVKILYTACAEIGSPQIRNLGTIGGNLATSSVAGDGVCALTTLYSSVVLTSQRGTRTMKLMDFFAGEGYDKRNALEADELLTEVFFEAPDDHTATAFYKLAKRKSLAISVIGGGMAVKVDEDGVCTWASMRGGCLGRYPLQFKEAEKLLEGQKLTLAQMQKTLPILHDTVLEINRSRPWSVFYKKESVQGVFNKLFAELLDQLQPYV